MSEEINHDRRRFCGTAAMTLGAAQGGIGHNLPQEAPQAFAKAVVDVDGH